MPRHQVECESRPSNRSTEVQLGEPMRLLAYYRHGHLHVYRSVGDGKAVVSWQSPTHHENLMEVSSWSLSFS